MNRVAGIVRIFIMAWVAATNASAADRAPWGTFDRQPDAWYRGPDGARVAANIRSHQSRHGDWPKNVDNSAKPDDGDPVKLEGTFDIGATVGELRFLARAFRAVNDPRDRDAFLKGLDHILGAQYPTGGWSQLSPPGKGYHRHIAFNDNMMVNLMTLTPQLRAMSRADCASGTSPFVPAGPQLQSSTNARLYNSAAAGEIEASLPRCCAKTLDPNRDATAVPAISDENSRRFTSSPCLSIREI